MLKHFFAPSTAEEIARLLQTHGPRARVIGAGSFINYLEIGSVLADVDIFITTSRTDLSRIESERDGTVVLGAATPLYRLLDADVVSGSRLAALRDATECLVPQVRNMATVGGCVATASPLFDVPVALMALDSMVVIRGTDGTRSMPVHEFSAGYYKNRLSMSEFVNAVRLPAQPLSAGSAFVKSARTANDFALINVAVRVICGEGNSCIDARIFVGGGVGDVPARAIAGEAAVRGRVMSTDWFRVAAAAAADSVPTISDQRASAAYRKALVRALVRRALETAADRVRSKAMGTS